MILEKKEVTVLEEEYFKEVNSLQLPGLNLQDNLTICKPETQG